MEDNGTIKSVGITESQKNIEQLASIWGAVKYWWCGICDIFDNVAPILVVGFGVGYAIAAYENTINDTKAIIPESFSYLLCYGAIWLMLRKVWESIMEVREH